MKTPRTTISIDVNLHHELKKRAVLSGVLLSSFVDSVLEKALSLDSAPTEQPAPLAASPEPIPVVPTVQEIELPPRPVEEPIIDPNATEYLSDEEASEWE